jgi:hypothetical protein
MDDLKKAQEEYLKRINDPSYVAPDILRNKTVHKSKPNSPTPDRSLDQNELNGLVEQIRSQIGIVTPEEKARMQKAFPSPVKHQDMEVFEVSGPGVNGDDGPFKFSGKDREGLAQKLGLPFRDGNPELNEVAEKELHQAIQDDDEDKELTERQEMLMDLMTDWRNQDAK